MVIIMSKFCYYIELAIKKGVEAMKFFTGKDEAVLLVSNSIINQASKMGLGMTHMKLQKLIYFVYKKYLKDYDIKLFDNPIESWRLGPVIRVVYDEYSKFGKENINHIYAKTNISGEKRVVSFERKDFYDALEYVLDKYGNLDGWDLSQITHVPGTAWAIAYEDNGRPLDDEDIIKEEWYDIEAVYRR